MTLTLTLPDGTGVAPGSAGSVEPRVRRATFGDGYIQRAPDGINTVRPSFTVLVRNASYTQAQAILDFLAARKGAESFYWTAPGAAVAKKFISPKWDWEFNDLDAVTIKIVMEQVFDP